MPRLLSFLALLLTVLVGLSPLDAAAKDNPRIAVLELSGPLTAQELGLLSDQIRAGVLTGLQGKPYVVMSRENMAAIAKDMNIDLSCVEGQCEVDTARNLGAAWVVSASLVQMGGRWMCTMKVHDVDSGALKVSEKVEGSEAVDLVDQLPPVAARLIGQALGDTGPKAEVQLGGEARDFEQLARDARQGGSGSQDAEVGDAQVDLGATQDFASLAAQAKANAAERARVEAKMELERKRLAEQETRVKAVLEAERKRVAEAEARRKADLEAQRKRLAREEAELKARMETDRRQRIDEARVDLLRKAEADLQPLVPLFTGPMSPATKTALSAYLSRYRSAKITVDGTSQSVTIPGVARVDRALAAESAREKAVLLAAQKQQIAQARSALLAKAATDLAAIKPLLEADLTPEARPVLEAFVTQYGSAKITVDDVVEAVEVPGVGEVQEKLGVGGSGSGERLSAGLHHTCAVLRSGEVKCWGYNGNGQGTAPPGTFTTVSAGYRHTCGVLRSGEVKCWGSGSAVKQSAPSGTYTIVSAGDGNTCGVLRSGEVKCWGFNGNGESTAPPGTFTTVSAGDSHTCGVLRSGEVKCWGDDHWRQSTAPSGLYTTVSAGDSHTCGVLRSGEMKCWGSNRKGQSTAPSGEFVSVSAGGSHSCGVLRSGKVKCWGRNTDAGGQRTWGQARSPRGTYTTVSAGNYHTCGVLRSGKVKCWGANQHGGIKMGQATPPRGLTIPTD